MSPDLNAIKARAEAATPGPWALCDFNEGTSHPPLWGAVNPPYFNPLDHPDQEAAEVQISVGCYEDAEFVAHAREDVPALLDLVAEQAAELARYAERLDRRTAELRDAHNDLLDVRGILSPAGFEPVTPLPLVPTVAPAVQWLVDRLAAVCCRCSTAAEPSGTEAGLDPNAPPIEAVLHALGDVIAPDEPTGRTRCPLCKTLPIGHEGDCEP